MDVDHYNIHLLKISNVKLKEGKKEEEEWKAEVEQVKIKKSVLVLTLLFLGPIVCQTGFGCA